MIGWVKQCMKPLMIDKETLALDTIAEVVRNDGDFLQTDNTLLHCREDWYPDLTERLNYDGWKAEGGLTLRDRARKKVDAILAEHHPSSLPSDIANALAKMVE